MTPDSDALLDALRDVIDPEVGMNIVDLGLVYGVETAPDRVHVDLTMTTRACPLGESIVAEAEAILRECVPDSVAVEVALVWDPPWSPAMMTDDAREHFGWAR